MSVETIPPIPQTANRQIARAAGTVMAATLLVQLLGLLRGFIIYRVFGTSADLDSFWAANKVADVLFNLMAGGALASAFIPTFTGLLAHEKRETAWKLASAIANLLLLILTLVAVLGMIFAPQIVRHGLYLLAPDQAVGQEALTIHLLRIMMPTVAIFGLSGLIMGILNGHQHFWLPAIAPGMYSLGQILGVWLLPQSMGIYRLAYGVLVGAAMHLLIQTPVLLRLHGKYLPILGHKLAEVREVLRLMGPRILGVAVVQVNFIVNTIVGLSLPEGSVSSLTLAFSWMLMPEAAIAQAIAIAAMPTFSAQVALGKLDEMRHSLASSLRSVLLLAIPASLGLMLLSKPLSELYQSHAFTAESSDLVAWALLWYSAGLVWHSLGEVLVRAFYSMHDTRTPVTITATAMGLNVVFSLTFPGWFASLGWLPLGGLALANSLATFLETVTLILFLRRRLHNLQGQMIWQAVGQAALGALGMGIGVWGWLAASQNLSNWLRVPLAVAVGGLIYGYILLVLRVPETGSLLRVVRGRMKLVLKRN